MKSLLFFSDAKRIVGGIFRNETGGKVLILKKYLYHEEKLGSDDSTIWKCANSDVTNCQAFILIKNNQILDKDVEHNHIPVNADIVKRFNLSVDNF